MMSETFTASASRRNDAGSNFSRLPSTRLTSGMAAKLAGSIWAAQPVTTTRASGRALLA
jgi:hypothetical protein